MQREIYAKQNKDGTFEVTIKTREAETNIVQHPFNNTTEYLDTINDSTIKIPRAKIIIESMNRYDIPVPIYFLGPKEDENERIDEVILS